MRSSGSVRSLLILVAVGVYLIGRRAKTGTGSTTRDTRLGRHIPGPPGLEQL